MFSKAASFWLKAMSLTEHEVLTVLTPQLEPVSAWLIFTCSRAVLLSFEDDLQLRQVLAATLAAEGRHLDALCEPPRFHAIGIGARARAALRRAVELRWTTASNLMRCLGAFSRSSDHRSTSWQPHSGWPWNRR